MLEVFVVSPKELKKHLVNCTMFMSFLVSIKVTILDEQVDCYEIWRTILRHDDVQLMTDPF